MSQHKRFGTVKEMNDRTKKNILRCIGNVVIFYNKRGIKIETLPAEPEFGTYKDEIRKKLGINLNLASKGENVP